MAGRHVRRHGLGTHWYGGIAGPYGWESLFNYGGDLTNGNYTFVANPGNDTNEVAFGLYMDGGWQRPHPGLAGIAGANIRVGDYYRPTVALHWIPATPLGTYTWAGLPAAQWIDGKDKNPSVVAYVDGSDAASASKRSRSCPSPATRGPATRFMNWSATAPSTT